MSHHHHHHHHEHHHAEDQNKTESMSLEEKLAKLLDHWIGHNGDHAQTYRDWGDRAKNENLDDVARLLEEAAGMTEKISDIFNAAAESLKSHQDRG